jgi:tRNA threonylcarbamoyl adenosine modification protein YeaZ
MKTLAMDLSTARASLAWFHDLPLSDPTEASTSPAARIAVWPNDRKDSGVFFEKVQETVRQYGPPQKIVVGLGPGSYAGIRIAISTAIGLQAAARAELVGYPSICAMEGAIDHYAVIGDARRRSFFFVTVRNRDVVGDYELHGEVALRARIQELPSNVSIVSSDVLPQFQPAVEQRFPSAEVLGRLAADVGRRFFVPPLEPIYLRDANVTMPKPISGGAAQ